MPTLHMLVGLPGSGKSTLKQNILKDIRYVDYYVYSTDSYIEGLAFRYNKPYNELFGKSIDMATKISNFEVSLAIEDGQDVIWDQTNLSVMSRAKKMSRFGPNYKKIAYFLDTSWVTVLSRNESRSPGRKINQKIIESMYKDFQMPSVDEGFDEVIIIKTN